MRALLFVAAAMTLMGHLMGPHVDRQVPGHAGPSLLATVFPAPAASPAAGSQHSAHESEAPCAATTGEHPAHGHDPDHPCGSLTVPHAGDDLPAAVITGWSGVVVTTGRSPLATMSGSPVGERAPPDPVRELQVNRI